MTHTFIFITAYAACIFTSGYAGACIQRRNGCMAGMCIALAIGWLLLALHAFTNAPL